MGAYYSRAAAATTGAAEPSVAATTTGENSHKRAKTHHHNSGNSSLSAVVSQSDWAATSSSPLLLERRSILSLLITELPHVFEQEVLTKLEPTDLALLASVNRGARDIVVASGQPRAGATEELPLRVGDFCRSVEVLKWARANGATWNETTFAYCAFLGGMEVVVWAREKEQGLPWNERAIGFAAAANRLDVLQYLREEGCPWNESCLYNAAVHGRLEAFVWLKTQGCPWNPSKTATHAAGSGSVELMEYLRSLPDFEWDENAFAQAAYEGQLDMLEYLLEHDAPYGAETFTAAAAGGDIQVLEWLRGHDFPCDAQAAAQAARHDSLSVLEWLHEMDYPVDASSCAAAAAMGNVESLVWLRAREIPVDIKTMAFAAHGGSRVALDWLLDVAACPVDVTASSMARDLETLQYLRSRDCPWDAYATWTFAGRGDLEMLRYARDHGCPWDEHVCNNAAANGHLENYCQIYEEERNLERRNCPRGHAPILEVLRYARESGCPWNPGSVLGLAEMHGHEEVVAWARLNGASVEAELEELEESDTEEHELEELV